ncbi:HAD hydrolase-like protein, partial [Enterococcus gallinarum]|nr:HAD hydrolase-like protein [Enterococcus gallinarum]NYS81434.1 HAD hydrolase-like protein [Enterococcus gallinarum]
MIKTILFDVDGTISDTEYVMTNSLQKTLREELEKNIPIKELHY